MKHCCRVWVVDRISATFYILDALVVFAIQRVEERIMCSRSLHIVKFDDQIVSAGLITS